MANRSKTSGAQIPLSPGVYAAILDSIEELDSPKGAFRIRHFLVEADGRQVRISTTTPLKRSPSAGR
jgi:hypothetical protein